MREHIEKLHARARDLLKPTKAEVEHGLELHRESVVVDAFGFAPYSQTRKTIETFSRLHDEGWTAAELRDKMLEMRVTEQGHDPEAREQYETAWRESGVTAIMQQSGTIPRHFARFVYIWDQMPELVQKATHSEDARKAKQEGRHCQFLSLNGLPEAPAGIHPLDMVDTAFHFGVRMAHLTYNLRNLIGDGCVERANGGLSEFGHEVVERMNKVGVLVDTPHSGRRTTLDAARASSAPVAASHTSCCSVYYHDRGKTDEEIKAIADTGGFIGIYCIPTFLAEAGTLVDMLNHIDYAAKLVGVDHVAIGTDTGTLPPEPPGVELKPYPKARVRQRLWRPEHRTNVPGGGDECRTGSLAWLNWPYFTVGLVHRGYSDNDIRKIIGGNVLRVLDDVQRHAGRT